MRLPLLFALLALPAAAQEVPTAATRLIEGHRLYQLGVTARDPILLVAAAHLMEGVTLQEVSRTTALPVAEVKPEPEKKPKKDKKAKPEPEPTPEPEQPATVPDPARQAPLPGTLDPRAMLEAARALLPDDAPLAYVIADLESEVAPPGAVAQVSSLTQGPMGNTTFTLPLAGQSYAEIALLRLSGELTLTVTDAAGKPLCADASATPDSICGLRPEATGSFLITVTNTGTTPASYLLITN